MATAISKANFEAALGECYDAISSGSYGSAWKFYAMAEAQHAGLLKAGASDGMSHERRSSLDGLKEALKSAEDAVNRTNAAGQRLITGKTGFSARGI